MRDLYVGLMSGTSLDGIDGVLVDFQSAGSAPLNLLAHAYRAFPPDLTADLLALNTPGTNELHRAALAGNSLARLSALLVADLMVKGQTAAGHVRAIGAHGQTVRHCPGKFDGTGYTLQLNSPALLAELSSIDVVADFRSRDLAAGGQGAPLAPAFHRALFGRADQTVGVLNIGGISNLTVLHADGCNVGFDCGPGNVFMDLWCLRNTGRAYDKSGDWAASGKVIAPLLTVLRADPYFEASAPKSTGRDHFNSTWLAAQLHALGSGAAWQPEDVQATLVELTASVCADDFRHHAIGARRLWVCGGGTFNRYLMHRIASLLPTVRVGSSEEFGVPANQVEACAFAWLARAFCTGQSTNLSSVTGAAGSRILGALYPSGPTHPENKKPPEGGS